jgi:hypothetical protein
MHDTCPAGTDVDEWATVARHAKAYQCLYIKPDIYSLIASEVNYPTFKAKWDLLHNTYGGASGSTTVLNNWIQLTQAHLDNPTPLTAQLSKLNKARVNLHTICGDSLLNTVMSPLGHEEQQGDDGLDGEGQGDQGDRGLQAALTRSRAEQC